MDLRPGLWRWTTTHPDWTPNAQRGSSGDWPPEVGSVAYAGRDAFTIIDPLLDERTWPALDELVHAHARPVSVLQTVRWHERSVEDVVARYGATAAAPDEPALRLPAGIQAIPIEKGDETMFWIEEHRALVPGDRLLNFNGGGLRVCPDTWLDYIERNVGWKPTRAELLESMRPLLELPVELVLVSHGEPVLANGREALARALEN